MGVITRVLFPLIAYLCIGTVVAIAAGYGYLRQSGKLDDERMFRIVSLLHGVDLEEIAETYVKTQEDIPSEEISYKQQQERIQLEILHRQGKQNDLKNLNNEFDFQFKRLNAKEGRFKSYKQQVELFLKQRKKLAIESGIVNVRGQLQTLNAKKQAKPLILQMIDEDRMDEVILLLNAMPKRNRKDILLSFDTEKEIEVLYKIQKRMAQGDPERSFIDEKLQELQQNNLQEQ